MVLAACSVPCAAWADAGAAQTDDGGLVVDAAQGVAPDAESSGDQQDSSSEDAGPMFLGLACDGALCATDNGSTCGVAGGAGAGDGTPNGALALLIPASLCLAFGLRRGARRPA